MRLKDTGEFGFIDLIRARFRNADASVLKGIGDDAAVIKKDSANAILVTTDLLMENVHFLRADITMRELGHKSLAVNLSDIAAMGGSAKTAVVSLAVPAEEDIDGLMEFYGGLESLARRHNVELVGGDTSITKDGLFISLTVLGEADADCILYRDGAKPGDNIYVSGCLGDSAYGLGIILGKWQCASSLRDYFKRAHHLPEPHLAEGRFFAGSGLVHAMIDISDGLSSDLNHICEASRTGANVYEEAIPVSDPLKESTANDLCARSYATLHGGEDYCLLLTGHPGLEYRFMEAFGRPLFRIGEIVEEPGIHLIRRKGERVPLISEGHDHFRPHAIKST